MLTMPWRFSAIVQTLSDDLLIAEGLLFPGASCLQRDRARLRRTLGKRLRRLIRETSPGQAWRYRLTEPPRVAQLKVDVHPLPNDDCRQDAVTLVLHYVHWRHGGEAHIAYFPALRIEVLAADEQELERLLLPQVHSALAREKTASHLRKLVLLDRFGRLAVYPMRMNVKSPTLKETALRQRDRRQIEKSVLKEVAVELAKGPLSPAHERDHDIDRLAELLTGPLPRSVLLVGRSGVGKTAIVYELVRRDRLRLSENRLNLWSTSGGRIVAGMCGFGAWQERCDRLVKEASRKRAIVHLDHLVELIEVGKGGGNDSGVAAQLRPAIAAGKLLSIAECSPEELAIIEREDPKLLDAFVRLNVGPTSPEQTRAILTRETEGEVAISPVALATLDRLHRRFAAYSAAPGRPLRFLRNLLKDREGEQTITEQEVTAAFADETGLPRFMLDDSLPLDVGASRRWFQERVLGQPEAVELVVDLLASVKAELARSGKPIASLLFIGPSGVGKTEMAKSLAEFLYRDRGRMIRFDMSEYSHPAAIERLIGGPSCSQGLLTQKVRDRPFMVVLLDEFEKADPAFHDILLQVLGEGRLTDGDGRVADFTSSVVIATSNLGADSIRHAAIGFAKSADAGAQRHFDREVKAFLRPEMYNRLDRIVPFAPLSTEAVAGVAAREIGRAIERDGVRLREVQVRIDPEVEAHVARQGFDARYGARPLKAAIERELIAPLAAQLNDYGDGLAIECRIGVDHGRLSVESFARPCNGERPWLSEGGESKTANSIGELQVLRRSHQSLAHSGAVLRTRNDIERLDQAERQRRKRTKQLGEQERFVYSKAHRRADRQREMIARVDRIGRETAELEEQTLLAFYASRPIDAGFLDVAIVDLRNQLQAVLFEVFRDTGEPSSVLTLAIYGPSMSHVRRLAEAYRHVCQREGAKVSMRWLRMHRPELEAPQIASGLERPLLRLMSRKAHESDAQRKVIDVFEMQEEHLELAAVFFIGISLSIHGSAAIALLETEAGEHFFERQGTSGVACNVETASVKLADYQPPADVGRAGAFRDQRKRRTYDRAADACRDALLKQEFPMPGGEIDAGLDVALRAYLAKRIWESIDAWS